MSAYTVLYLSDGGQEVTRASASDVDVVPTISESGGGVLVLVRAQGYDSARRKADDVLFRVVRSHMEWRAAVAQRQGGASDGRSDDHAEDRRGRADR